MSHVGALYLIKAIRDLRAMNYSQAPDLRSSNYLVPVSPRYGDLSSSFVAVAS